MKNKKLKILGFAMLGIVGVTSGVIAGLLLTNKKVEIPGTGLIPAKPIEYTKENTKLRLSEKFQNELIANNNINNNEIKIINISSETEKYNENYDGSINYPFDLYSIEEKKDLDKEEGFREIQKIFGNELNNSDAKFAIFENGELSELVLDNFISREIVVRGMESLNVIRDYGIDSYIPSIISSLEVSKNKNINDLIKPVIKQNFSNEIYNLNYKNINLGNKLEKNDYNVLVANLINNLEWEENNHYFDEGMKDDESGEGLEGKEIKYEEFVEGHRNDTHEDELFIEYEISLNEKLNENGKFEELDEGFNGRLENLKGPREGDNPNKIDYVSIDTKIGYNITEGVNMDEVREKVLNGLIKTKIIEDERELQEMENGHGIVGHDNFKESIIENAIVSSKNENLNFSGKLNMNQNYREEFYQKAFEGNEAKYSWDFNYGFQNSIEIEVNNRHLGIIYDKINLKNYDLLGNAIKNELNLGKERGHIIILERDDF